MESPVCNLHTMEENEQVRSNEDWETKKLRVIFGQSRSYTTGLISPGGWSFNSLNLFVWPGFHDTRVGNP